MCGQPPTHGSFHYETNISRYRYDDNCFFPATFFEYLSNPSAPKALDMAEIPINKLNFLAGHVSEGEQAQRSLPRQQKEAGES